MRDARHEAFLARGQAAHPLRHGPLSGAHLWASHRVSIRMEFGACTATSVSIPRIHNRSADRDFFRRGLIGRRILLIPGFSKEEVVRCFNDWISEVGKAYSHKPKRLSFSTLH